MARMTKVSTAVFLMLAAMLATSNCVRAQEPAAPAVGTWEAVKALPSRDELTVILKDGSSQKGKVADVTDIALTLSLGMDRAATVQVREQLSPVSFSRQGSAP